jgi:putative sigma-54 modulation protein
MKVLVHGRNVEITDWVEEYVQKKVKRLERYLPNIVEMRVELTESATRAAEDRFTAQITIWDNRQILRAEETSGDIYASIDAAVDKISRQIQRFKGRMTKEKRRSTSVAAMQADMAAAALLEGEEEEEEPGRIIRRKAFSIRPMHEEEALEQMELLGHDFFVFQNAETNSTNVIYKRKDGNYGLLQPQAVNGK